MKRGPEAKAEGEMMNVPDGWMLVPVDPTKEMLIAGWAEAEDCLDTDWDSGCDGESYNTYTTLRSDAHSLIYKAMLAAAPKPPLRVK